MRHSGALRESWVQQSLPWLFAIYALPGIAFLSVAMPPFQVTDELAHALRADQVALGGVVSPQLGGEVHRGLIALGAMYRTMWFHAEVKQTVELARQAGAIEWSDEIALENFQNTAQYGPFLYVPQATALRLAAFLRLSFAQGLLAMRLVNGIVACSIGFLALRACRRGRALMFTTLLLPMTLSEFGSASQDALIISLTLLVVAIASRVLTEQRVATLGEFALFAFAVAATTAARPSQIALALLTPAFVARRDPRLVAKLATALPVAAIIVGWLLLLRTLLPPTPSDWSLPGQFEYVVTHPFALPAAMLRTFVSQGRFLGGTLVGHLGWLDTPMPIWFFRSADLVLLMAFLAPGNRGSALFAGVLGVVTFTALLTTTCFALYLSWNPVAHPTIAGLQGRYVLGVLPLLAWVVPAYDRRRERQLAPTWIFVALFPLLTLATLPSVIMERYYGSWTVMRESLEVLLLP